MLILNFNNDMIYWFIFLLIREFYLVPSYKRMSFFKLRRLVILTLTRIISIKDFDIAPDPVPTDGAHLVPRHLLKPLAALPAHALVTAWDHRCVPRLLQADDALILLLALLRHPQYFHNKLLVH